MLHRDFLQLHPQLAIGQPAHQEGESPRPDLDLPRPPRQRLEPGGFSKQQAPEGRVREQQPAVFAHDRRGSWKRLHRALPTLAGDRLHPRVEVEHDDAAISPSTVASATVSPSSTEPGEFLAPSAGKRVRSSSGKTPAPVTERNRHRPVVLVVDDDQDILEALAEILEAEGFEIRRARNGQEALERLFAPCPQLILLDLMMPVMDGWEFALRLRQRFDDSAIPIIVLSADRNVGAKAREIGAVGHLGKPFELNELLDLVRSSIRPAAAHPA
ncbi:MAG: response regulator [Myxococcales bacterium]|nr:response regulator [Myxococcales bacterium]